MMPTRVIRISLFIGSDKVSSGKRIIHCSEKARATKLFEAICLTLDSEKV